MEHAFRALAPLLVLPIGVVLVLLVASFVARRRELAALAALLLWAFSTPLVAHGLARAVEGDQVRLVASDMRTVDAIVVLSIGRSLAPGPAAVSEWIDADRFFGGLELARSDGAPWLVFTGGTNPSVHGAPLEGDVLMRFAIEAGIAGERVRSTGPVRNTAEEAAAVADLLRTLLNVADPPHVLVVTSAFHMPRASALFERAGMLVTPFPVDFQVSTGRRWSLLDLAPRASSLRTSELALREWLGRLVFRVW